MLNVWHVNVSDQRWGCVLQILIELSVMNYECERSAKD